MLLYYFAYKKPRSWLVTARDDKGIKNLYSVLLYYGLFAGCDVEAFLGVKNLSAHKVV